MTVQELADLINAQSNCWAIENQNRTGGPESIECPRIELRDIDSDALRLAGEDPVALDDVAADAVLRAFLRRDDLDQIPGLTRDWIDTCGAYSDGFIATLTPEA